MVVHFFMVAHCCIVAQSCMVVAPRTSASWSDRLWRSAFGVPAFALAELLSVAAHFGIRALLIASVRGYLRLVCTSVLGSHFFVAVMIDLNAVLEVAYPWVW